MGISGELEENSLINSWERRKEEPVQGLLWFLPYIIHLNFFFVYLTILPYLTRLEREIKGITKDLEFTLKYDVH